MFKKNSFVLLAILLSIYICFFSYFFGYCCCKQCALFPNRTICDGRCCSIWHFHSFFSYFVALFEQPHATTVLVMQAMMIMMTCICKSQDTTTIPAIKSSFLSSVGSDGVQTRAKLRDLLHTDLHSIVIFYCPFELHSIVQVKLGSVGYSESKMSIMKLKQKALTTRMECTFHLKISNKATMWVGP